MPACTFFFKGPSQPHLPQHGFVRPVPMVSKPYVAQVGPERLKKNAIASPTQPSVAQHGFYGPVVNLRWLLQRTFSGFYGPDTYLRWAPSKPYVAQVGPERLKKNAIASPTKPSMAQHGFHGPVVNLR